MEAASPRIYGAMPEKWYSSHQSLATNPQSLVPFLLAVLTEPVDLNARIGRSEAVLL